MCRICAYNYSQARRPLKRRLSGVFTGNSVTRKTCSVDPQATRLLDQWTLVLPPVDEAKLGSNGNVESKLASARLHRGRSRNLSQGAQVPKRRAPNEPLFALSTVPSSTAALSASNGRADSSVRAGGEQQRPEMGKMFNRKS